MSYGRELYEEMRIDYEIYEYQTRNSIESGIWKNRDGEEISIKDMSSSYIQNCINYLNRKNDEYSELWIDRFEKELSFRDYIKNIVSGKLD